MRTTLNLPDDVYQSARDYANYKKISLGNAIAELIRNQPRRNREMKFTAAGVPYFEAFPGATPITLEMTLAAEADLEDEI